MKLLPLALLLAACSGSVSSLPAEGVELRPDAGPMRRVGAPEAEPPPDAPPPRADAPTGRDGAPPGYPDAGEDGRERGSDAREEDSPVDRRSDSGRDAGEDSPVDRRSDAPAPYAAPECEIPTPAMFETPLSDGELPSVVCARGAEARYGLAAGEDYGDWYAFDCAPGANPNPVCRSRPCPLWAPADAGPVFWGPAVWDGGTPCLDVDAGKSAGVLLCCPS